MGEGWSAGTSAPFVAVVAGAKAAAKEAAAALKQQRLLLLPQVRELYVSVVLAGMAEAQRELGLCLAGLDEGRAPARATLLPKLPLGPPPPWPPPALPGDRPWLT